MTKAVTPIIESICENSEYWNGFGHCIKITDSLLVLFTFLLFAVTAILAVATMRLWKSTQNLVAGAEETARRQLRAYIFLRPKIKYNATTDEYEVIFKFVNSGQTPAYNFTATFVRNFLDFEPNPFPLIESSDEENLERSKTNVGANHKFTMTDKFIIDAGMQREIQANRIQVYFYGEANYQDTFGRKHKTTFRLKCEGLKKDIGFIACYQGNEVCDEE